MATKMRFNPKDLFLLLIFLFFIGLIFFSKCNKSQEPVDNSHDIIDSIVSYNQNFNDSLINVIQQRDSIILKQRDSIKHSVTYVNTIVNRYYTTVDTGIKLKYCDTIINEYNVLSKAYVRMDSLHSRQANDYRQANARLQYALDTTYSTFKQKHEENIKLKEENEKLKADNKKYKRHAIAGYALAALNAIFMAFNIRGS